MFGSCKGMFQIRNAMESKNHNLTCCCLFHRFVKNVFILIEIIVADTEGRYIERAVDGWLVNSFMAASGKQIPSFIKSCIFLFLNLIKRPAKCSRFWNIIRKAMLFDSGCLPRKLFGTFGPLMEQCVISYFKTKRIKRLYLLPSHVLGFI